jgi:hypothetical protein
MIFTCASDAQVALVRITEQLFRELQTFGRLAAEAPVTVDVLETHIKNRLPVTNALLIILERNAELKFSPTFRFPYIYQTVDWPKGVAPAGYVTPDREPYPSDVAKSLSASWALETRTDLLPYRLLKAMLWHAKEYGVTDALTFLFDLYDAGYISNSQRLGEVASYYLLAAVGAESGDELIEQLTGCAPGHAADWMDWQINLRPETPEPLNIPGGARFSGLLERAFGQIERVRQATDLDAWIDGQTHLCGLLGAVRYLARSMANDLPITVRAALSKIEEIDADAFVVLKTMEREFPTGQFMMTYARLVIKLADHSASFRKLAPNLTAQIESIDITDPQYRNERERWAGILWPDHEMLDRVAAERLFLPAELGLRPNDVDESDLPLRWRTLSWRMIRPWMAVFRKGEDPSNVRIAPFSSDVILAIEGVCEIFDRYKVPEELRLGIVTELGNFSSRSQSRVDNEYPELERELRSYLPTEIQRLSASELDRELDGAYTFVDDCRYTEAAERFESLCELYQYSWPAYYGLAVCQIGRHEPAAALEQLVAAIVLNPRQKELWQALSRVLHDMGHGDEAGLVREITQALTGAGLLL